MTAVLLPYIDLIKAAVLGLVEGLTEFLPVSSTGHLLLMERLLGWSDDAFGKSFTVLIQLGAILALLTIYFTRLWNLALNMFTSWPAARFVIGVLLAFLPAAVIGALAYGFIKSVLFDVRIVCITLVLGGFVLLWVDRMNLQARRHDATEFPLWMYFAIGLFQCVSMIPGVSRAGATIVGAMLFGGDRRAAAEFSFWLAMPTMVGAFAFEAYKSRSELAHGPILPIAVGFVASFIFGWIVVKTFLRYVQRHSFAVFA
jgi:undecaprenyl-diphosphatase